MKYVTIQTVEAVEPHFRALAAIDTAVSQHSITDKVAADMKSGSLRAIFDAVCCPHDWKAPIEASIPTTDEIHLRFIAEAVEFFTATSADMQTSPYGWTVVKSVGYRRGPAGG
jgi:hypothetical protein